MSVNMTKSATASSCRPGPRSGRGRRLLDEITGKGGTALAVMLGETTGCERFELGGATVVVLGRWVSAAFQLKRVSDSCDRGRPRGWI